MDYPCPSTSPACNRSIKTFARSAPRRLRTAGNSIVLVFSVLMVLLFQLTLLSGILTVNLTEEGVLLSHNIMARRALESGFTRISQKLNTHLLETGMVNIDTAFAQGGDEAIVNEVIQVTNPEDDSNEQTDVRISAWLAERRGNYYHLMVTAQMFEDYVNLESSRWIMINPCDSTFGTLRTVTTGTTNAGYQAIGLNEGTGRVFFRQDGSFNAWDDLNGILTLLPTATQPGAQAVVVDSQNNRVYFGDNTNFYTWHQATGLSTLLSSSTTPGQNALALDQRNGRVYFGDNANFYSWHPASGLSTVVSGVSNPGQLAISADSALGHVFFGDATNFYAWHPSGTLMTLLSGSTTPGRESLAVVPSQGTVYFGDNANFYTWNPYTKLQTILDGSVNPGFQASAVDPQTGRVFFGDNANFYSWYNGRMSTILSLAVTPGRNAIGVNSVTGRVFFGEATRFFSWHPSMGATPSLIANGLTNPGQFSTTVDPVSGRVYFADHNATPTGSENLYWWNPVTETMQALATEMGNPGEGSTIVDAAHNRLFFGDSTRFFAWQPGIGLQTILGASSWPGRDSAVLDETTGRVIFASSGSPSGLYQWTPPDYCQTARY